MTRNRRSGAQHSKAQQDSSPIRRGRPARAPEHSSVDIYQSLIEEAQAADSSPDAEPPPKRLRASRALDSSQRVVVDNEAARGNPILLPTIKEIRSQYVDTSSETDDSDDLDFEDVDLAGGESLASVAQDEGNSGHIRDVSFDFASDVVTKHSRHANRQLSRLEKEHALIIHKMHVLCLLAHCLYVNSRCNRIDVQSRLLQVLDQKAQSYLDTGPRDSQFQQNRSFIEGLQMATGAFNARFQVTQQGISRNYWSTEGEPKTTNTSVNPMDAEDFVTASKLLEGSQDTGNQLFCAMLRAAGVTARLVCSLQVLPVRSRIARDSANSAVAPSQSIQANANKPGTDSDTITRAATPTSSEPVRRRLGRPGFIATSNTATPQASTIPPLQRLSFPVFWVEAFNHAYQKWVPLDPLVTHSINKASKLAPPLSYSLNRLTYAIAFEQDGHANDVTRRYAQAYNAKTRRLRVEGTSPDGARWWRKVMKVFQSPISRSDRSQIEAAELSQFEAREGLPSNILDFVGHPHYALERHLKRHEVIHPKREVGKVNAGTAARPRMEAVYRRRDVMICRSADKWFRMGRTIKSLEQPLKLVATRSKHPRTSPVDGETSDVDSTRVALYAESQTQLYVPPPIRRGRVTKNNYGNLDIYVPSMVPAGGVHIRHIEAQRAAKLLRLDYADAVTGFKFQGRRGTAIVDGVVVAQQYKDAINAVIAGFDDEMQQTKSRERSFEALQLWRKFLVGLRIAERVSNYGDTTAERDTYHGRSATQTDNEKDAGGFFATSDEPILPTAGHFTLGELGKSKRRVTTSKRKASSVSSDGSPKLLSDTEEGRSGISQTRESSVFEPESPGLHQDNLSIEGGGFLMEEADGINLVNDNAKAPFEDVNGFDDSVGNDDEALTPHSAETDFRQKQVTLDETGIVGKNSNLPASPTASSNLDNRSATIAQLENHAGGPSTGPGRGSICETVVEQEHQSDGSSMISHDPDDEEAEPDWLESD